MRLAERVHLGDVIVPVLDIHENDVIGLPPPEPGVLYVVSGIVASNVNGREDVVSPGRMERDRDGNVRRAKALVRVRTLKG